MRGGSSISRAARSAGASGHPLEDAGASPVPRSTASGYDLEVKSRKADSKRAVPRHHAKLSVRRPYGTIMIDLNSGQMTILGYGPGRFFTVKFSRELTDLVRTRLTSNNSGAV